MPPPINGNIQLNPAQNTIQEQPVTTEQTNAPRELANAKSSGWKTFGRVAAGIFSLGFSELIPLAWKGIKALFSHSSQAPNGAARVAGQPSPLPAANPDADRLKSALSESMRKHTALPGQYQQAADEVLSDLRGTYGSDLVPEGMHVAELLKSASFATGMKNNSAVMNALRSSHELVSPEGFKDLLRNNLRPLLNCQAVVNQGKELAKDLVVFSRVEVKDVVASLLKNPEFESKINTAKNPAEALAAGNKFKLAETLRGINKAFADTVNSLRERFGQSALPGSLSDILNRPCSNGGPFFSNLNSLLSQSMPVTVERAKNVLNRNLLDVVQTNIMYGALSQVAKDIGLHLNNRALKAITEDLLDNEASGNLLLNAKNPNDVKKALDSMNLKSLLQTQKQQADALYSQHAPTVSEDMKPILKEFIAGLPLVGASAEDSRQMLSEIMPHFQNWQSFTGMEPDKKQLNDVFKQYFANDYSKLADAPGEARKYEDSIYKTMLVDSNRSSYTINGQNVTGHDVDEGSANMKAVMTREFPNEKDRQFVSKIMNQRIWASLGTPHTFGMLPESTQPLNTVPGGTNITYAPGNGGATVNQGLVTIPSTYSIQVSEDRTTAHITMTSPFTLDYADESRFNGLPISYAGKTVSFTFDVNLSAHPDGQGITNVAFGQKLLSMEEYKNL